MKKGIALLSMPFISAMKFADKSSAVSFVEYAAGVNPCNFLNGTFEVIEYYEIEM
jgi:hypothetical protein